MSMEDTNYLKEVCYQRRTHGPTRQYSEELILGETVLLSWQTLLREVWVTGFAMPPKINNISSGDGIHIAWIDPDETCNHGYFEVEHVAETNDGYLLVDVSNDTDKIRLVQLPKGPLFILDHPDAPDDTSSSIRVVIGAAPNVETLISTVLMTLYEMGYSVTEATNLLVLRYCFASVNDYTEFRNEPFQAIENRIDDIVAELASPERYID